MKMGIKNLWLLPALVSGLGVILAGHAPAQVFTLLYSLNGTNGANPYGNTGGQLESPQNLVKQP